MSMMVIKYNELDGLTRVANRLTSKLDERMSDLNRLKGNINDIDSGGRRNLEEANYFITKKNQKYQKKRDKLDDFKNRVISFKSEVESTDKRVANRISSGTKGFRKANNISISPVSAAFAVLNSEGLLPWTKTPLHRGISSVIESAYRDIKADIKDWYYDDGGKYTIDFLKGTVAAIFWSVVAIVAPSPATIFKAVDSVGDAICNGSAMLWYIRTGDKYYAEKIGDMGLNNIISEIIVKPQFNTVEGKEIAEATVDLLYGGIGLYSNIKDFIDLTGFLKNLPKHIKELPKYIDDFSLFNTNFINKEAKALDNLDRLAEGIGNKPSIVDKLSITTHDYIAGNLGDMVYNNLSDIKYLLKDERYIHALADLRGVNELFDLFKYSYRSEEFIFKDFGENISLISMAQQRIHKNIESLEGC